MRNIQLPFQEDVGRQRRPLDPGKDTLGPRPLSEGDGPRKPDVQRPGGGSPLLERMKRVDPNHAKRYRQRSGE